MFNNHELRVRLAKRVRGATTNLEQTSDLDLNDTLDRIEEFVITTSVTIGGTVAICCLVKTVCKIAEIVAEAIAN